MQRRRVEQRQWYVWILREGGGLVGGGGREVIFGCAVGIGKG